MAEEILETPAVTPAADEGKDPNAGKPAEPSQRPQRTQKEKVAFNLRRIAEEARKEGIDPAEIIGVKLNLSDDLPDETPLTVGSLKEFQKQEAHKNAVQMADEVQDESDREEIKKILTERIKPSGNPQADFELAQAAANAVRTSQIAKEQARRTEASRTAAGGTLPGKTETQFEPTTEESAFMSPPWNLSKEKILEARKKAEK